MRRSLKTSPSRSILRPVTTSGVIEITDKIIDLFKFLIEKRRLSEELYHNHSPRPEKAAQRLFYAVADAYCNANNLDVTPEADTGNGPVDFKLSTGKSSRVLVEIKLSINSKLVAGYNRQLTTYDEAEEALHSIFLIIDVGGTGENIKRVYEKRNERAVREQSAPAVVVVDGRQRVSASKLK